MAPTGSKVREKSAKNKPLWSHGSLGWLHQITSYRKQLQTLRFYFTWEYVLSTNWPKYNLIHFFMNILGTQWSQALNSTPVNRHFAPPQHLVFSFLICEVGLFWWSLQQCCAYMCSCVDMCVHIGRGQRSRLGMLLNHILPYFWAQGLSWIWSSPI